MIVSSILVYDPWFAHSFCAIQGLEGCAEEDPVNFQTMAEDELEEVPGRLQVKDIPCPNHETAYIKIMILSGYHDFCTVHRVIVE